MFQHFRNCVARGACRIYEATKKVCDKGKTLIIGGAAVGGVVLTDTLVQAEPITVSFTPIDGVNMLQLIDPTVLASGIAALGATALVAAFAVGGGFKISKKTFNWIMGKI